jgi:hypothetical protein
MINIEKLLIYKSFNGDIDGFARLGTKLQKEILNEKEWYLIDDIIQNINIIKKGLTSVNFEKETYDKLKDNFESELSMQYLIENLIEK